MKKGDKVKVIDPSDEFNGEIGVIVEENLYRDRVLYNVEFDNLNSMNEYDAYCLEIIK